MNHSEEASLSGTAPVPSISRHEAQTAPPLATPDAGPRAGPYRARPGLGCAGPAGPREIPGLEPVDVSVTRFDSTSGVAAGTRPV